MQIIQIVPGLPPRHDGIGDYTLNLARHLRTAHGIETLFLVGNPNWEGPPEVEGFTATKVSKRTPDELIAAVKRLEGEAESLPVLVQFSVYGYEKRGCPFWLISGLEKLAASRPGRLYTAFHELENSSWKPWSSVFWVTGIQKSLIGRTARIARFNYTNCELHRTRLETWGLGRISLIMNFSTLGEPTTYPPFSERQRSMVVFGRSTQRGWTYERGGHLLGPLCRRLGIERIVDIGDPLRGAQPDTFDGVPVVRMGRLPAEEVNRQMATAMGSFLQYPVSMLTKSSIHAVSCAFGTTPFVFDGSGKKLSCPPLITGEDFVPVDDDPSKLEIPPLEELSRKVWDNYQLRASWHAAATLAKYLTQ